MRSKPGIFAVHCVTGNKSHSIPLAKLLRMGVVLALATQFLRAYADPIPAISINPMTQVSQNPTGSGTFFGFIEYTLQTNGVYGWSFRLEQAVTVTGFGWYDDGLDGLAHPHQVGIWMGYQPQPLLTLTIPAGTNAPLNGPWRIAELNQPVTLPVGEYVIGGMYYSESPDIVKYVYSPDVPFPGDPRIRVNVALYSGDPNAFQEPNGNFLIFPENVELGPMFFVLPAAEDPNIIALAISLKNAKAVISWPASATNVVFETSGTLNPNATWTALTNGVIGEANRVWFTNEISGSATFFRLRRL